MKIKHIQQEIDKDNPFANCQLGREKYANVLTSLVNNYSDGFVLAINNEWGTGKSTFIKMWKQKMDNEGFETLLFNAWENDFDKNPLIAILSELKNLIGDIENNTFKSLLKIGSKLSLNIAPILLKSLIQKHIDITKFDELTNKITEGFTNVFNAEIDEYFEKKNGLHEFKVELAKYIKNKTSNKPIVFIIDELDRCKPSYAVEVLEIVKHFFDIPGIVFVLSIDKNQLGNAIKGFYGSEDIDSNEYLKRFIDLEYKLPQPSIKDICKYYYTYYEFDLFFNSIKRKEMKPFLEDKKIIIEFATLIFEEKKLNIRQIEKLFIHLRVTISQFKENEFVLPSLIICLLYLREFDSILYTDISNRRLTIQKLSDIIEEKFSKFTANGFQYIFISTYCHLIQAYYNSQPHEEKIRIIDKNTREYIISTKFDKEEIFSIIEGYRFNDAAGISLLHLTKKLDLTEEIIVN